MMQTIGTVYSIDSICRLFGKSRQAWYYKLGIEDNRSSQEDIMHHLVQDKRKSLPRIGGRKLYFMLQPELKSHGIEIGRDRFFSFLRERGLLVNRKRKYIRTTDSMHRFHKYPNLIKDMNINGSHQVYVSDITYIRIRSGFVYLSLITDAYSKKIVGFRVYPSLSTKGCLKALRMALSQLSISARDIIHHSDRGLQYCSYEYTGLLIKNDFRISMTHNGDPYENAIAERVNGILKDEFNLDTTFADYKTAREQVSKAIETYNQLRPHLSIGMLTPEKAHNFEGELSKCW